MATFAHPALLWGLALAGAVVLIHLINMFRHRQVRWAAMEFLLASQKRHRTWIVLRQLLLLLVRMAAIAAMVLLLAGPRLENRLGRLFGGGGVHHIILCDDSFSMADRAGSTSAFDAARAAIERIAVEASSEATAQSLTLLRFSQAGLGDSPTGADLLDQPVGADLLDRLGATLEDLQVSHTAAGPLKALDVALHLVEGSTARATVVYLLSDFRARQWEQPAELRKRLERIHRAGGLIRLVGCVDSFHGNLAISDLSTRPGAHAAGVPLVWQTSVTNYSDVPAKDVVVRIEADGVPQPAVAIPRIPPGQSAGERFALQFAAPGQHEITVRLDTDAVDVDNARFAVVDLPAELPVLVVDGDPQSRDAMYFSAALRPQGPVGSGIRPRAERPRFLADNPLDAYTAIYLMNVERLPRGAIEALEGYLAQGGGVGVFLGPRCSVPFYNDALYRAGKGFFPLPLRGQEALLVDRLEKSPDVKVTSHPIFRVLAGQRNSFLSSVTIQRYFSVVDPWPAEVDATVRAVARLRNGAPLVLEREFGHGRVVVFLTTAGPLWNNWARSNPSYVVAMLELQAYLSARRSVAEARLVGSPLEIALDPADYTRQVRVVPPEEASRSTADDATEIEAALGAHDQLRAVFSPTRAGGIYRAELTCNDGGRSTRRFAFNVDPAEGDLRMLDGPQLAARLEGIPFRYERAEAFRWDAKEIAGGDLSGPLLALIVLLLLFEQWLAYTAGYHRRGPSGGNVKGGGR